ncbi:MAG: hypothetical protein OIF32_00420, partial [Campylobacterales bacterium]|nr:hypothetical protein [Campylobacterales bacterium]
HAKYKKMGILVHEKRHNEIKDYLPTYENLDKKLFPNLNEEVRRIARKLVKVYLDGKDCKNSIDLIYKYNILIPKSYDDTMSYCGFQLGDYDFVVNLSNKYIESNSPADSIKWQRRKADALYKKSDYLEYILQAQRISRIDKALENKPDKEMYLKLFKAYSNIGQNDKLIPLMKEIKEYFPKEARILDLYKTIIEVALKDKKYDTVDLYATKLLNQQRVMNIDVFSPFVEFALAEAGVEQKVYDKAINVLDTLVTQELDLDDRFQSLYRLGELYSLSGNGNKSKETFEKCKQLEGESSWKELCKQR